MTNGRFPALHGTEIERVPIQSLPVGIDHLSRVTGKSAWSNNVLPTRELLDLEFHRKLSKPVSSRIETPLQPVNYRFDARLDGITMSCGAHIAATKRFVIRSGMQLVIPQAGTTDYKLRGGPSFRIAAGNEASILGPGEYRSTSSQVASIVVQVDEKTVTELSETARQIGVTLISSNVRTLPLRHSRFTEPVIGLRSLFQSLADSDISYVDTRSAVFEFLLNLLMIERTDATSNLRHQSMHRNATLQKALAFISENLDSELTNHQLCQTLNLKLPDLFRLCADSIGCTPQVWIQTLRLERSFELIKANPHRLSLKLVAKHVGFKTYTEFRIFFFNHFGRTPEQIHSSFNSNSKRSASLS